MASDIPPSIVTPNRVETRIGTLEFLDGVPLPDTMRRAYDNLDFMRAVQVFLTGMRGASLVAIRAGLREVGCVDGTIGIYETGMDARSLFLTPNSESIYTFTWLDLSRGPVVVESPPNTLGVADDFWFRYVADLGNAGPDRGQGGKFLFLPPGFDGDFPPSYFTFRSTTFNNILLWRGFRENGDPRPAVESIKARTRLYPLAQAANPPPTRFVNLSGRAFNTIHATDFHFFEEINQLVQDEPVGAAGPELTGLLAALGIAKGRPFAPDARMRAILEEAALVANATARTITYANRDPEFRLRPDSHWERGFVGGSHEFLRNGQRLQDAVARFFFYATVVTPAMAVERAGIGSQYAMAMAEAPGRPFDGGRAYRLRLPPNVPAKDFWSVVLYDAQTRSMLQTDQDVPSVNSYREGLVRNADGSVDLFLGPAAPVGLERNWIQTLPGKSWTVIFRLYGPLQPWFDQAWRPEDIVRVG